MQYPMC